MFGTGSAQDSRNLILAIVISVVIMLGYQVLFEQPRIEQERAKQEAKQQSTEQVQPKETAPQQAVPGGPPVPTLKRPAAPTAPSRAEVLAQSPRLPIVSPRLHGSVSLAGGRIDDLTLRDYHERVEKTSPEITLLSPPGAAKAFYARFGWLAADPSIKTPGADTVWHANRERLSPDVPVTLSWSNGAGLTFERVIAVDQNYMFTVTDRVRNAGGKPVTLYPFGLVTRSGTPKTLGFFILHEGPIGVFNGTLQEPNYSDIQDEGSRRVDSKGGWIGFTDHYWLTALVPDQKAEVEARFLHRTEAGPVPGDNLDKYQVDLRGAARTVQPGAAAETSIRLFAGAKEVRLLDRYEETLGIARFDRAVDFGWFYFLTKPIFYVLDFFYRQIGNFGVAIILLTVLIKLLFFPLANKSYRAMSRLKQLQPKLLEIRERFKDDRARQNQEMMELYKRENANPAAGCLPIAVQIPVFFALYKVLFVTIEMRHAPFFGWIQDLSAPDPLGVLTLFGLVAWHVPDYLHIFNIGIWPMIMGTTMWLQQRLNPAPADPTQAKIMMFLPIVFTFVLGRFAAGLVIYWTCNNLLSITQQWVIMRRMGVKIGRGGRT